MTNDRLDAIPKLSHSRLPVRVVQYCPQETTPAPNSAHPLVVDGYDIQEWRDRALQAEGKLLFETCYGQDQHSRAQMYSDVCDSADEAPRSLRGCASHGYLQPVTASACIDQEKARKATLRMEAPAQRVQEGVTHVRVHRRRVHARGRAGVRARMLAATYLDRVRGASRGRVLRRA